MEEVRTSERKAQMRDISSSELEAIIDAQSPWRDNRMRFHRSSELLPERRLVSVLWMQITQTPISQHSRHKVISGPRRVGKTTVLRHLAQRLVLEARVAPEKVVYISMDEPALSGQRFDTVLEKTIKITQATMETPAFVLADEIAYAEHWDRALKIAYDDPERYPVRIVATSSSAIEMAKGIQESGAGRWVHHFLLPCQFSEQASIASRPIAQTDYPGTTLAEILASVPQGYESSKKAREALDEFSVSGGFPEGAYHLGDSEEMSAHVLEHYNNLREALVKVTRVDIPQMFSSRHPEKSGELLYLLAQQPCGLLNLEVLSNDLGISKPTTENILGYLEDAMVVFRLPDYTGSIRKAKKWCFLDNAIAAALSYQTRETVLAQWRGLALENMVGAALFELVRQSQFGTRLFHCRENGREIDFVLVEGNDAQPVAINVSSSHRHGLASMKYLIKRHPEFTKNAYLVSPDAVADRIGDIKTLPLAEFLLAVEYRKDILVRKRVGHRKEKP